MRKSVFTTVMAAVFAVMAMTPAFAGSLDQTNPPGNAAGRMSTLTEIYNCIDTGNCVSKSAGGFTEPILGPGSTGKTLDEIMDLAKQRARVPKTGDSADGATGVSFPNPRFTVNAGTVKDNLTGLIWLQNAKCTDTISGITPAAGKLIWQNAKNWIAGLAAGACGLTDGSTAGQWRLPNVKELQSLIAFQNSGPALPTGHPFGSSVQLNYYWSATSADMTAFAWLVHLFFGVVYLDGKTLTGDVLPVR